MKLHNHHPHHPGKRYTTMCTGGLGAQRGLDFASLATACLFRAIPRASFESSIASRYSVSSVSPRTSHWPTEQETKRAIPPSTLHKVRRHACTNLLALVVGAFIKAHGFVRQICDASLVTALLIRASRQTTALVFAFA